MLIKMIKELLDTKHLCIIIRNRGISFGIDLNENLIIFEGVIFCIYNEPNNTYINKWKYSYGNKPVNTHGDYYGNFDYTQILPKDSNFECFEATRFNTLEEATCYLHTKIRKEKIKKILNDGKIY